MKRHLVTINTFACGLDMILVPVLLLLLLLKSTKRGLVTLLPLLRFLFYYYVTTDLLFYYSTYSCPTVSRHLHNVHETDTEK